MEFKKYKLGEVAEILNGATPSTLHAEYYGGDIPWFTPKDLSDQGSKYVEFGERSLTQAGVDSCSASRIPPNNILMSSRAPIGLLAINKYACYTNQGFKNIILNSSTIDVECLYYYLKHRVREIESLGGGTTFKEVSKKTLEDYELSLPPLEEQKKIAGTLALIDRKIELCEAQNRTLEKLARQIYDYWFVQFDFPDENGRPYKSSGGKMVYNEKLKREIPEGWEVKNLQKFLTIKNGKDHKALGNGIFPVYGSGGEIRRAESFLYRGESILLPRKGTLNNVMYVNEAFWTVDTMFFSEIKVPNSAKFVFYSIKNMDFERLNSGTGVPSMTASTFYTISLFCPDECTLKRFDLFLAKIFRLKTQNQKQIQSLTSLRERLLPLLMNGQVEVRD